MEKHVKERLIGAAVLVAAAIILVPEMLSGPPSSEPQQSRDKSEPASTTYRIDLNPKSTGSTPSSAASPASTAAPPPEMPVPQASTPSEPSKQADGPAPATTLDATPAPDERAAAATPSPAVEQPPSTQSRVSVPESPSPTSSTASTKPPAAAHVASGWAVQVGSFGSKATADRVAAEFTRHGYSAFVASATVAGKPAYRVRLGPLAERAAAEALLKKAKSDQPNATLVSNP